MWAVRDGAGGLSFQEVTEGKKMIGSWRNRLEPHLTLYKSGSWPDPDFDTFIGSLESFDRQYREKPFGEYSFLFYIDKKPVFDETSSHCWMIGRYSWDREALGYESDIDGNLTPKGGPPYAEVKARKTSVDLKIDLLYSVNHEETMCAYLWELHEHLIKDGFISDKTIGKEPKKPQEPNAGDSIDIWFDYYHAMQNSGHKITFRMLEEKSGFSEQHFKNMHSKYKDERGIDNT
jgi:hypothetical protein